VRHHNAAGRVHRAVRRRPHRPVPVLRDVVRRVPCDFAWAGLHTRMVFDDARPCDWVPRAREVLPSYDWVTVISPEVASALGGISALTASGAFWQVEEVRHPYHDAGSGRRGANTALRDAPLLCRALTAAKAGRTTIVEAVGTDEAAEMVPYEFVRVADSLHNNGTSAADALYRPGLAGRMALFGARSSFSLTAKVPALRRTFLADLSTCRDDSPAVRPGIRRRGTGPGRAQMVVRPPSQPSVSPSATAGDHEHGPPPRTRASTCSTLAVRARCARCSARVALPRRRRSWTRTSCRPW